MPDYKPPCEVDRFKARQIDPESLDSYDMRNLARAFRCEMDSRREAETRVAKLEETIRACDKQTVRLTIEQVERQKRITELEEALRYIMHGRCSGCRVGQPYDGHSHTETADLLSMPCTAQSLRDLLYQKKES